MTDRISVAVVDAEAAHAAARQSAMTRAKFLRRTLIGGGTLIIGGVAIAGMPKLAEAGPSANQDVEILNYALLLEFLEAAFYTEAERIGRLSGDNREFANVVGQHERDHVAFLQEALGNAAISSPTFDFGNTTTNTDAFQMTAIALEDTGVSAYLGQATRIRTKLVAPAVSILTVESRHAAWIRDIVGQNPAPRSFDQPRTIAQVTEIVQGTGFIQA